MGRTTELRRALKERFVPYAVERGFVVDERRQPGSTVFRRSENHRIDMFEVQWEKYGKPRFAVHFGTCPADGLRVNEAVHAAPDALPTWCPDAGSLQPRRGAGSRSWFRQDSTIVERLLGRPALRAPGDVVNQLLALFAELERYWRSGDAGPHMRFWKLTSAGNSQANR